MTAASATKREYRPLREFIREAIADPELAAEYLNAARADGESQAFLIALKDVVEVHGGLSKLARETKLNRPNLHKMLSGKGSPKFETVLKVLAASGFEFIVTAQRNPESSKNQG